MISKAKLKYIKSLQVKKYRNQEQCFLVEGAKSVKEILRSDFEVIMIAASPEFLSKEEINSTATCEVMACSVRELSSIGTFQTNEAVIAVAKMKPNIYHDLQQDDLVLALDDIRDPGNLGTIIRTADWYGIKNIIASAQTVDLYNPKVITASMGSFCRVNVFYAEELPMLLHGADRMVFGAFLQGHNVHEVKLEHPSILVIGNESNGISDEVELVTPHRITIPRYGHAESLNAGVATAIILDNLMRSQK